MICRLLVLFCAILVAGCSASRTAWLSAASPDDMKRLSDLLMPAPVVFIGEFHDQPSHHDLQLEVIKALEKRRIPLVIGLEMFDMESQPVLDRWSRNELDLDEFMRVYRQNWTIAWSAYDRILLHARNQRIPLIGLNAPQDLVARVSRYGWQALRPADTTRLPAGVTAEIADDYRDFLVDAFTDHRMSPALFENFCAAQGLRNNTMALLIKQAMERYPDAKVLVITGVGHAMRRGTVNALGAELAGRTRIVVPYAEGLFDHIDVRDTDYIVTE